MRKRVKIDHPLLEEDIFYFFDKTIKQFKDNLPENIQSKIRFGIMQKDKSITLVFSFNVQGIDMAFSSFTINIGNNHLPVINYEFLIKMLTYRLYDIVLKCETSLNLLEEEQMFILDNIDIIKTAQNKAGNETSTEADIELFNKLKSVFVGDAKIRIESWLTMENIVARNKENGLFEE